MITMRLDRNSIDDCVRKILNNRTCSLHAVAPVELAEGIRRIAGFIDVLDYPTVPDGFVVSGEIGCVGNMRISLVGGIDKFYCLLVHADEEELINKFITSPGACVHLRVFAFDIDDRVL